MKQALPLAEDNDEIVLRLSALYLEEERFDDLVALADYEVDSVLARWNIARAYQALDDEEEAFQIYQAVSYTHLQKMAKEIGISKIGFTTADDFD